MSGGTKLARWMLGPVLLTLLVSIGPTRPASAEPSRRQAPVAIRWDSPAHEQAFGYCMQLVDWVTHGLPDEWDWPDGSWETAPWQLGGNGTLGRWPGELGGFGRRPRPELPDGVADQWDDAAGTDAFVTPARTFTPLAYRPQCHLYLPDGYRSQIPEGDQSAVYRRCLSNLLGDRSDRTRHRPVVVPAWYWRVSLEVRDCYLLLPPRVFGLRDVGDEAEGWSDWTTVGETLPDLANVDEDIAVAYSECLSFIDWRMEGEGPPGSLDRRFEGPPNQASAPSVWHAALNFWRDGQPGGEVTTAANWTPNCELLLPGAGSDETPYYPDDGSEDPPTEFSWMVYRDGHWQDDVGHRDAFAHCLKAVDWVAHDREGDNPGVQYDLRGRPRREELRGVSREEWETAVDWDWLLGLHSTSYSYRPRCDELLPDDYVERVPERYKSDAFKRCLAMINDGNARRRPEPVPVWYWEVSREIRDCYLLLPLRAFGLGGREEETTAWSHWTEAGEADPPELDELSASFNGTRIVAAYERCRAFIPWRMEHGKSFMGDAGEFNDPPNTSVPARLWHQAIDFWAAGAPPNLVLTDPGTYGDVLPQDTTVPAEWNPDCDLLVKPDPCVPASAADARLLPDLCLAPEALSHYDIGYSQFDGDDAWDDTEGTGSPSRGLWGGSTGLAFTIGKGLVQVAVWGVDWAFNPRGGFDIRKYDPLALRISHDFGVLLDLPQLRLREILWLVLFSWVGYTALRGQLASAGAEILMTVVLLALSTLLVAQSGDYMSSVWDLMDHSSKTLLVAGSRDPTDPTPLTREELARQIESGSSQPQEEVVTKIERKIVFAFVTEPYDYINWGRSLGRADDPRNPLRACAAARNQILAWGPHGTDPWPRMVMHDAGGPCQELAKFNADPTGTRLLEAVLVMVASLVVAIVLLLMALTIVLAKVVGLLLFGVLPFAALMAIPPARGRRLLWGWATTILQVLIVVIGMSFLLSLLLLALQGLLGLTENVSPTERFALMILMVVLIGAGRRHLLHTTQTFSARLGEFLSAPRGTGATWASAAATAREGVNLTSWERPAALAGGYALAGTTALAGRSMTQRWQERRQANRGYKNLVNVSYWKRDVNAANYQKVVRLHTRQNHKPHRPIDLKNPKTWPTDLQPLG